MSLVNLTCKCYYKYIIPFNACWYRQYADVVVDHAVNTVNNIQDNHNKQENMNFKSSKSSAVYNMFNRPVKNKSNLQFKNVISKNRSIVLDEHKNIKKINVYNAVDLIKINNDKLYTKTKSGLNHVLFDLNEISSEGVGDLF